MLCLCTYQLYAPWPLCRDRWGGGGGGLRGDFTVWYTSTLHPWGFTEGSIPHFKGGSYVGDIGGFDTSS